MTFSIVAIDKEKKEVGFAIASCCWNAGMVCRAGVGMGAIASQASGNLAFLNMFFDKVEHGRGLEETLEHFQNNDDAFETRQVGMITFKGEVLAVTGSDCDEWAGHRTGQDYSIQGNTLVGPEVIENMVKEFENSSGQLMDRLYAALRAGDDAGGDARGKQSARLLVLKRGGGFDGSDNVIDMTFQDHPEPVREMGRMLEARSLLVSAHGNYEGISIASKEEKLAILEKVNFFLEKEVDDNCRYCDLWTGLGDRYYELGMVDEAVEAYRRAMKNSPNLVKSLRANSEKGKLAGELANALFQ